MHPLVESLIKRSKTLVATLGPKRLALFGAAIIVLLGMGFLLGNWRAHTQMAKGDTHSEAQAELYQCPMHPTYVSDRAGECPICGMTLVRVKQEGGDKGRAGHESEVEGHASITIATERQQLIGVKSEVVRKRKLTRTINTVGWIAYDPDLYRAQEEYLAALKGFRKIGESAIPEIRDRAEKLVESAYLRLRLLGLSDEQIKDVASKDGPDQRLLLGDALDTVWLYGTIYEYELGLVKEGDLVEAEARAFPGEVFTGHVQSIDTVLDPKTRSVRVRALIPNPDGKLKPQMFANARIHVSLGEHLSVPKSAVMDTGTRKLVYVDYGEGHLMPHEVRLGHKADDYYTVLGGIEEGQRVITSGNFLIDSESRLRAATTAAASGGHQH